MLYVDDRKSLILGLNEFAWVLPKNACDELNNTCTKTIKVLTKINRQWIYPSELLSPRPDVDLKFMGSIIRTEDTESTAERFTFDLMDIVF